ncbi:APC family permease [Kovacikia minuta CCNUW1]|uniref:APC family permease n=1 Tax=Kovacikia minuta TaxID=2931930 RepID=UPI001CCD0892|nr:APC family permease [Kovacikia minuta]UBF25956.1 APC family permease [Kovacikia minuta CCNUW1]
MSQTTPRVLRRALGVPGAVLMGLGSIVGTGVFVSLAIAAGIAGPAVILAVAIAALVAICNGLNSAQLAASHPVSGGTYEYGYHYLNPWLGFTAGWLFLLAKSASAATAALGFAGYLLNALGLAEQGWLVPLALVSVLGLTVVVLNGIQRSNQVNIAIVSVTLLALAFFILAGLKPLALAGLTNLTPFFPADNPVTQVLHATALVFVAYTGYGRIATMGEEVREPRQTIPRAIILTMLVTMALYLAIAVVGVGAVGTANLSGATQGAAPLEVAVRQFAVPGGSQILAIGAVTAMLGVLLNLILGLSRVLLAMGRRGDMPRQVARLNRAGTAPSVAVVVMGAAIALLVLSGNVKTTWSFSAFTVLVYYAITNLAALRLPEGERLYPKWLAWLGLAACLFLAFWVDAHIWLLGLGLILVGLLWKAVIVGGRW